MYGHIYMMLILCIWAILVWVALGSRCAALGDQIQIFVSAFGWGQWLDINPRIHVFSDWWKKSTDIGLDHWIPLDYNLVHD